MAILKAGLSILSAAQDITAIPIAAIDFHWSSKQALIQRKSIAIQAMQPLMAPHLRNTNNSFLKLKPFPKEGEKQNKIRHC